MTKAKQKSSMSGLSMIEILIAVAVAAILMVGVSQTFSLGMEEIRSVLGISDGTSNIAYLRNTIRKNFRLKTRVYLATGAVTTTGVSYDAAVNPLQFSIRTRLDNLTVEPGIQYDTVCQAVDLSVPYQAPAASFCAHPLPTCPAGQRHVVRIVEYVDFAVDTPVVKRTMTIPASGATRSDQMLAAALCVIDANMDRIRLKVAVARRNARGAMTWRFEDIDVWEDVGQMGIEFLKPTL